MFNLNLIKSSNVTSSLQKIQQTEEKVKSRHEVAIRPVQASEMQNKPLLHLNRLKRHNPNAMYSPKIDQL